MGSDLLKKIPVAMRWYIGCLLILGLVPIGLSIWYPLDGINNFLNRKSVPVAESQVEHLNMLKSTAAPVDAVPASETAPVSLGGDSGGGNPEPVNKGVDWVQLFGGINSAVIGWLMFYEQRRKMRLEEKRTADNDRTPIPNDIVGNGDRAIIDVDDSDSNSG